ncbi:RNA-directed DNA polymerase, eukaryota [Tanacetum coccineum]
MEDIELFNIKLCWGNFGFEFVHSPSVGNSGEVFFVFGILDCFVSSTQRSQIIQGEWAPNGKKLIIISVYAPQELREKKMLWDYLILVLKSWNGDVIIMGDFNEVRTQDERHGSIFNAHGADAFNLFISSAGLEEVPLDGCKFTWCHKSGSKMSKLDRFLISEGLLNSCPNISSITLDRYLSDHRPILLRESHHDYGPSPFRFFHYWFELEGFDTFVKQTWNDAQVTDSNAISMFMKKMKYLKEKIRMWVKANKENSKSHKQCLQEELSKIDLLLDKGEGSSTLISKRMEILKSIQDFVKLDTMELAQKAKIKWAIEGDENSKYYHGVLNKKRNQLAIRGILVEGRWIESPILVKDEFLSYFASRFNKPPDYRLHIDLDFPNKLSLEQQMVLEIEVTREEIKKAVWDCGVDKSPGPDGFTFGFYRRYWTFLENDVVEAVLYFFNHGQFPKGSNSSFITLIPKTQEAKMMKDFRPITLIGSLYKIIAKILANRLVVVLEDLVSDVQSAFVAKRQILDGPFILNELFQWCKMKKKHTMIFKVDFEKAYDSVRWDYLDDVLKRFGFGEKWCGWIQNCLLSSKGSVIVNGSPTKEFQFHRGLKQGDPLSPFLFLLIMESLHISMQRVVDAGLFRGIQVGSSLQVSHLFYADDAVFMGHWSEANIDTILRVLDCFYHASGLRINMLKSKLMGISVSSDKVDQAAKKIGCAILQVPFSYLGSKVGCLMSRIQSWSEIVNNILTRLSKWKLKTLSIGGRLTLLKSVLGSLPIYHMSLFKVPAKVLLNMESIRCHFFNGIEHNGKKPIWVKWNKVLASKEKGGLGVSSFYALNRALLFKWVWRFCTQQSALWTKIIKGIHGEDGKIGKHVRSHHPSLWLDIVKEVQHIQRQGTDLMGFIHRKMGNGVDIRFWEDKWRGDNTFQSDFPRMYALETQKNISVALKLSHDDLLCSFRRAPRAGAEELQYIQLVKIMEGITLFDSKDRWRWSLEGCGEFTVASVRNLLDANSLPVVSSKTRWIKAVPIKVNIHAWKVKLDILPTRLNISKRGMDIESILCPLCEKNVESSSHIFFTCPISREIFRKVLLWWEIDVVMISSYDEWLEWLLSIRLHSNHKELFEGVCYILWWYIWNFCNKSIFGSACPSKALIFEELLDGIEYKHLLKATFDVIHNPELDGIEYKHLLKAERKLNYVEQLFIIKVVNANLGVVRAHNLYTGLKGSSSLLYGTENRAQYVFVHFTAIDNHKRCVIVGSCLFKIDTTESYGWLLRAFRKAFVRANIKIFNLYSVVGFVGEKHGKENGVNIIKLIDEGPFHMGTFRETLAEENEGALHLGLPKDIYTLINHYTDAKDIWYNMKMLLEGSELMKEDRESQLFVTAVKLNRGLRDSNYNQLYAYLKQHEAHANENKMMLDRFTQHTVDPLALMSNVLHQQVDRIEVRGTMQGVQVELVMGELITELAMQIQVKQEYFKDKMLLMQAQENGMALDEEQLLFITGGQDNIVDEDVDEQPVQDLTLNVDNIFQADDCDAFNSDVDETPPAQTMFMANLSSADPAYDEASASYDSDILSEVPDHDNYQDAVCEHHEVHEMHDDVQLIYVVDSHADYTSDSNMIPYDQYSAKCVSVTTQINVVDKSLNAELATYKEQVELYERQAKFELTERE